MSNRISKLSEAQEQKLASAMSAVAANVNEGLCPAEAISKAASDKGIPAGQVKLMVHAYNTGRSLERIRNGSSLADKSASFPLASVTEVLELMYPSKPEKKASASISSDYRRSVAACLAPSAEVKEASVKQACKVEASPSRYQPYEEGLIKQALGARANIRRQAEEKRLQFTGAGFKAAAAYDELCNYFNKSGSIPFSEVRDNVAAVFGKKASRLMATLSTENPRLLKTASLQPTPVDWKSEPYTLVENCLNALSTFEKLSVDKDVFAKTAKDNEDEVMRPFPGKGPLTKGSIWAAPSSAKTAAGFGTGAATGLLLDNLGKQMADTYNPDKGQLVNDKIVDLEDPYHEDKLKTIQARTMLYDLMANDPVISGYSPEEVTSAYNNFKSISPKAMQQRPVVQSLLRKYLSQGQAMDQFELGGLMDSEKTLAQTDLLPPNPVETRALGQKPVKEGD